MTIETNHDNVDQHPFQQLIKSKLQRIKAGLKTNGVQNSTSKMYL